MMLFDDVSVYFEMIDTESFKALLIKNYLSIFATP
jgi:hypothetical protein